jgi:NAD-dependent SIR2 family protein deacetylase
MNASQIAHLAFHNMQLQKSSKMAGCYHCTSIFEAGEVVEQTDGGKTALCPKCKTDAVLFDCSGYAITQDSLESAKKYWF